jgi:hypothetical protein
MISMIPIGHSRPNIPESPQIADNIKQAIGCIGGSANESIDISSGNARITIYVTVITEHSATVNMTWERGTVP